jgi:signal transduction histidine kinase
MATSPRKRNSTRPAAAAPEGVHAAVVESLTSGVLVVDAAGRVVTANPAAARQLGLDAAPPAPGTALGGTPALEAFARIHAEIIACPEPVSRREITLEGPDGERVIGLTASVLRSGKHLDGVIFLFADLTAVRALERSAELNRQLAQIGELTAGVVHELRNPLSVISGMAELLLRRMGAGHPLEKHAATICHEAAELEKLIRHFLLFARPFTIERTRCAPDEIVERAITLCERQARERNVALTAHILPDPPVLEVDHGRLAQAIGNLVRNAIEVLPEGGRIDIRVQRPDADHIAFLVEDDGPGIQIGPKDDLLSPFFSKKEGGTGLGLSICHRIVSGHGGEITYGNRDTAGAWFKIVVPIQAAPLTPA